MHGGGIGGGEGFAFDASMIKADANRQRGVPGSEGLAPEMANLLCASISPCSTMPRVIRRGKRTPFEG